jgi:tetratricopeptide (TPR) repeat protein
MNTDRFVKSSAAILLTGILAFTAPVAAGAFDSQQERADDALAKLRSMAEAQHEIVMLLMRKKEFSNAAAEANKIFQMRWPADQEPLLLTELLGISNQFQQHKQEALALQLLEDNHGLFKQRKSQIDIYKELGYICKRLGRDDEALAYFKKAHDLEKAKPIR